MGDRKLALNERNVRAVLAAVDPGSAGTETEEVCRRLDESPQRLGDVFEFLKEKRILLGFGGVWFHPDGYLEAADLFISRLTELHQLEPGRGTLPPLQVVRSAGLNWPSKAIRAIVRDLIRWGRIRGDETGVRLPDFRPTINIRQQVSLERVVELIEASGFHPLGGGSLARAANLPSQALREILRIGEYYDQLVPLAEEIWLTPGLINAAVAEFRKLDSPFPVAAARDALATSRRIAHAILEYLESVGRAAVEEGHWRLIGQDD